MAFGPIQLIIIGFDDNERFQGDIARELDAVRSHGVIRLVDALFVSKDQNGDLTSLEASDFAGDEAAEIGTAVRALLGMNGAQPAAAELDDMLTGGIGITPEEVQAAADNLDPGTSALYLLIEHTWATGLKNAVRNAGGYPILQGLLTPEAVMMMGAELEAILEAEATIELAEAVKGAAILEALITMEAADIAATEAVLESVEIANEAIDEAEEVVNAMVAIRAAAAAEAVRALIVADLIEESAAEEATQALVAAGLIEDAALEAATASADEAEAERVAMLASDS